MRTVYRRDESARFVAVNANYLFPSGATLVHPHLQRCLLKIISRQNPYPNYRNDDYFLQKLLQAEVIHNLPEDLAAMLRGFFERQGD